MNIMDENLLFYLIDIINWGKTASDFYDLYSNSLYIYWGSHKDDVDDGFQFLKEFENTKDIAYIDKAFSKFNNVSRNDRDFVRGGAAYGKAYCYAMKMDFKSAYKCLNDLDAIKISWKTVKSDELKERQRKSLILRNKIRKMEQEYKKIKVLKWVILVAILIILFLVIFAFFDIIHIN